MRALVIGYGSIGARHARLLNEIGCEMAVVSRRPVDYPACFADVAVAVRELKPDYAVVANATSEHHQAVAELASAGFSGSLLIEKPVLDQVRELPTSGFRQVFVAYNLRFHPIISRLHELVRDEEVLTVNAYVGQYLPDWRPGSDYRLSYSASAARGGGVLRDLSHELDYLHWCFGGWRAVTALGGHVSRLEIDSDDAFTLTMRLDRCPIAVVQMSYLDRVVRRQITVNTARHTYSADLVAGTLAVDRDVTAFSVDRDHTYREMHRAILAGEPARLCTLAEGMETLRLIEAAEMASAQMKWVAR